MTSLRTLCAAAFAVALIGVGIGAASADAVTRLSGDPCSRDGQTLGEGREVRVCMKVFDVPPHTTKVDPDHDYNCPNGYYNDDDLLLGGWGDYWTLRSEWVTWMPMQGYHNKKGVNPGYHNWGSWNWPTRTILTCHKLDFAVASFADDPSGDKTEVLGQGDDVDQGTAQDDDERGGKGDDTLGGGKGDDELLGGPGADHLSGGPGDDELFDDQGKDIIDGGPGNDRFSTKDGNHDVIDCGPGEDIAVGDPHDSFTHCEHVYTTPANTPHEAPVIG
jgi:Ca2+-binding RTX toxin-like protein